MNKIKVSIILLSIFFASLSSFSQEVKVIALRHIKGVKGIELNYGIGGNNGRYYQAMYDQYFKDKWMGAFGVNYEQVKIGNTSAGDIIFRHDSYFTVAGIKQRLYFNIVAGAFLGMERIGAYTSTDNSFIYPETNKFLFGLTAGGNMELYINNTTSFTITGEQYFNPNSPLGIWKFNVLAGLRIYFN